MFILSALVSAQAAEVARGTPNSSVARYDQAIGRVEQMTFDPAAQELVRHYGLDLVNVTWEDTARDQGSVAGPNISDMTIGVRDTAGRLHPMPVIRFANFSDKTADVRSDQFWLRVGNEDDSTMRSVSLRELLTNTERYLSSEAGDVKGTLWSSRDVYTLVSAQAVFLPVPRAGEATFTPVLYNYASTPGNPAVLTIVATSEGTSVQVVENSSGYMSEVLYFNEDGQRAPFAAHRASDVLGPSYGSPADGSSNGLNAVVVVQVPLKYHSIHRSIQPVSPSLAPTGRLARGDVEDAVVTHGDTEGPFKELAGLTIERDPAYPVRATVQFYKATAIGAVTNEDVASIRRSIDRVYDEGDFVGSLVTGGSTGRPTEWTAPAPVWAGPGFSSASQRR